MRRIHSSAAFFFAGATVFCAGAWSTPAVAAWIAHTADAQTDLLGASGGTTEAATPSSATDPWTGERNVYPARKNAMTLEHADPWSGSPSTVSGNKRPHLTLDGDDPWAAQAGGSGKRTKVENGNPWDENASKLSRSRLPLDLNDPWSNAPPDAGFLRARLTLDASDPWHRR